MKKFTEKNVLWIVFIVDEKMETALYIKNKSFLSSFNQDKYDRIYFGDEFCEKKIKSMDAQINFFVRFSEDNRVPLTILLPYCTEYGFGIIEKILNKLPEKTEVVFNDWGVLSLIKKYSLVPIMGRLLVTIKRDPRIFSRKDYQKQLMFSNLDNVFFQKYLLESGIKRIELDNVFQGYSCNLCSALRTSIYIPDVYITTTRKCVFLSLQKKKPVFLDDCDQQYCQKTVLTCKLNDYNEKIYIKGNSQFYYNEKILNKNKNLNFDRIIYFNR